MLQKDFLTGVEEVSGTINCDPDAACKLIGCKFVQTELRNENCRNSGEVLQMRDQLRSSGYEIQGMSVKCLECRTVNGHNNCSNRFGIQVNTL